MAVSISAIFKLADKMSDKMDKIGNIGDKAMSRIEQSTSKADKAFSRSQSSASKLSSVYKNFEVNAEQLTSAVQKGEKTLNSMEQTQGKTAATTFDYSNKLNAATEAQKSLDTAMANADKAAKEYESAVSNSATSAEELKTKEEALDTATRELFEAFDKGANAALDLEEATEKVEKEFEDFTDKTEEATKNGEEFGEKTGNAIESIDQLLASAGIAVAVKEITSALLDCAAAAETVETSAAKLETLAGSGNMAMLSDQIYTISAASGTAQEDLYEVAYNAISAGTDVKKAGEMTEAANKLATAGFTTSSAALSVLTTATNSYGKAAGSATDITDGLITVQNLGVTTVGELANSMGKSISTAAAYNVSLNNLESAYISVTKAGISTQEGTTYINAMISELGKSNSDVAKILKEETGKSFGELTDSGYSLADVLEILYNKAGKNSEAMMNLWGSQTAGVASAAIVNQGLETFNSNLDALKNSAGATEKAYKIMGSTTEFAHNKMKNSAENLKASIGQQLNPTLEMLYKKASNILEGASNFVKEHPGVVKAITAIVVGLGAFAAAVAVAKVGMIAFNAVLNTNPIFLAISAIAALTAGFVALGASIEAANEQERRETLTVTSQKQKEEIEQLTAEYEKLKESSEDSSEEADRLKYKIDDLSTAFEENSRTIGDLEDSIVENRQAVSETIQDYKDTMDGINNQSDSVFGLIQKLQDLIAANDGTAESEGKIKGVIEELNQQLPGLGLNFESVTKNVEGYVDIMKQAAGIKLQEETKDAQLEAYNKLLGEQTTARRDFNDALIEYTNNQIELLKAAGEEPMSFELEYGENWRWINDLPENYLPDDYDPEKDNNDPLGLKRAVNARNILNDVNAQIKEIEEAWAEEARKAQEAWENPADAAEAAKNILEKYTEEINNLCTAYGEAYDAALSSFQGQFDLFEQAKMYSEGEEDPTAFEKSTVEAAQEALNSQLEYWETYNNNLEEVKKLTAKDLGLTQEQYDAFMANIQDGSEEAAGLAQSIVNNIKSGNSDAVETLAQTYAKVQEEQEKAADTVADWKTDFYNQLEDIEERMKNCVNEMNLDDEAKDAARYTIESYAQALRNNMGTAVAAAKDVASGVEAALSNADTAAGIAAGKGLAGLLGDAIAKATGGTGYALGTDYATAGVHLVGENGPELVLFKGGEEVVPADDTETLLNNSTRNVIPDSLLTTTYSDSNNDSHNGDSSANEKTYNLNINGSGSIKVDGSTSKEEVVAIMLEQAKPIFMSILEDEITEEGDDSYDY